MKSCIRKMALVLSMMCIIAFASPLTLFAGNSLDDLSSDSVVTEQNTTTTDSSQSSSSNDDSAISDYLHGFTPVTQDNMKKAGTMASPIVSALGTFAGFIIMCVSAGIFVITALDLAYIGIPPIRSFLNPQLAMGGAGGGMPMGGMGMGMGMRGGMMGGMGMGGMSGAQGAMPEQGLRRKWVSDEAIACVNMAMQGQQGAGAPMGGMGGMGMGSMGMGGMGMGGMNAMNAQTQPVHTKSVIFEYLKKRMFFIIVFTVASVILMSSLLTDCGLNLAELLSKVIDKFNGQIASVNV